MSSIKFVNLSNTLLHEKVILALCASQHFRENLKMVKFDKCVNMREEIALMYLLRTDFVRFKYKALV